MSRRNLLRQVACFVVLAGCAAPIVNGNELDAVRFWTIAGRVGQERDVRLPADIRTRVVARAEVPEMFDTIDREVRTAVELEAERRALRALGFWPDAAAAAASESEIQSMLVAGFYVPSRRELYVVREAMDEARILRNRLIRPDWGVELTLAHEIVHVIQHEESPNLIAWATAVRGQTDPSWALRAAEEGDAVRFEFQAFLGPDRLPTLEAYRESWREMLEDPRYEVFRRAPAALRIAYDFPYQEGYRLALAEGRQLMRDPPASTEQVLHPERRREAFTAIDLGPVAEQLPAGCQRVIDDSLGELMISALLRGIQADLSPRAWTGWDGDRALVADCGGRAEFLWLTFWDSAKDAEEFEAAYRSVAPQVTSRGGLGGTPGTLREGRVVTVATPGLGPLAASSELARIGRVQSLAALRMHFGASLTDLLD